MPVYITVQSVTDPDDLCATGPIDDPATLMLAALRTQLASWLDKDDRFLSKQQAPIVKEDTCPVSDVASDRIILIRRAPRRYTVQSEVDASDAFAVPSIIDPTKLMLSTLRTQLGAWLEKDDRFLSKEKDPILGEEARPVSGVASGNIVFIRRALETVAVTVKRDGAQIGAPIRFPATANLATIRQKLKDLGVMSQSDAFVNRENTQQIEMARESKISLPQVVKTGVLAITSREDWG